jgi:hypothetical protein
MSSRGMVRLGALGRTDVSEERSASIVRVTRIGELGTTLAVSSNRRTLRRISQSDYLQDPHGRNITEGILRSHRLEKLKSYLIHFF